MNITPSSSSSTQTNTSIQVGVGVGVASYSTSNTPFNPRPTSSSINIPACNNRHFYHADLFDSSSSSPPSSSTYTHQSCSNFQPHFNSNLTLTLITATPLTTLTTTAPLIPIVQQLNTTLTQTASLPSSSNTSILTQNCININQLPCSSSVSSSSASPSRDWFTYEYKLDNIEDLIKSHETQQGFVQSPSFSFTNHLVADTTTDTDNIKQASNWRLIFYPNGAGTDCKNFLSIFLKYMSDEPVKIQMMFSIVDNNNEDVYVKYTVNKFQKSNDWGFKQLIHKNAILYQKDKFLKENKGLLVRVKMRLDEHKNDYLKKLTENLHYCKLLSDNLSQFYNTNEVPSEPSTSTQPSTSILSSPVTDSNYYDILLLVKQNEDEICDCSNDKKSKRTSNIDVYPSAKRLRVDMNNNCACDTVNFVEFKAHKCILAARSPVFKAMFNYKLKENLTNQVVIEDCRPEVVKAMLKYIYTAYLPDDVRKIAFDLYIAAEKYFIESLKIKCREFLVENLSLDNCIQVYILAEMYNDSMLRKQSLKFINENIDKVTQNSDWNDFMTNYPQFFTNAFIRICKKDF